MSLQRVRSQAASRIHVAPYSVCRPWGRGQVLLAPAPLQIDRHQPPFGPLCSVRRRSLPTVTQLPTTRLPCVGCAFLRGPGDDGTGAASKVIFGHMPIKGFLSSSCRRPKVMTVVRYRQTLALIFSSRHRSFCHPSAGLRLLGSCWIRWLSQSER